MRSFVIKRLLFVRATVDLFVDNTHRSWCHLCACRVRGLAKRIPDKIVGAEAYCHCCWTALASGLCECLPSYSLVLLICDAGLLENAGGNLLDMWSIHGPWQQKLAMLHVALRMLMLMWE